jgi:hypothetical protein
VRFNNGKRLERVLLRDSAARVSGWDVWLKVSRLGGARAKPHAPLRSR